MSIIFQTERVVLGRSVSYRSLLLSCIKSSHTLVRTSFFFPSLHKVLPSSRGQILPPFLDALPNIVVGLPTAMPWIIGKYPLLALNLVPGMVAGLSSLLHRQIEIPQTCLNTITRQPDTHQTTQDECKGAAMQLCGQIPSKSWAIKDWTTINSGSCRAMVYHDDHMQVPTMDECMQSLGAIISSCITQQPGTNDGGGANQSDDLDKMAMDWTKSVYQIGSGAHSDKAQQMKMADIAAAVSQEGAATMHA